jgi:hypothetical protein
VARCEPFTENLTHRYGRPRFPGRSVVRLHPKRRRAVKIYRGSRRRVRQLRLRGNASAQLWLFVGWVAFLLLVVVPWMIRRGR